MNLSPENINFFILKNDEYLKNQTNIILIWTHCSELSPESITTFILCCENKDFHINESNVFNLRFLSVRYEVPKLRIITKKYIADNLKQFPLESLLANKSLDIKDTTFIENVISENFHIMLTKKIFCYFQSKFFIVSSNDTLINAIKNAMMVKFIT